MDFKKKKIKMQPLKDRKNVGEKNNYVCDRAINADVENVYTLD